MPAWFVHRPSMSQRPVTDGQLAVAGLTPGLLGLLRFSAGLEDLEDRQDDSTVALAAARQVAAASVGA